VVVVVLMEVLVLQVELALPTKDSLVVQEIFLETLVALVELLP
jgi:hypothetical protein